MDAVVFANAPVIAGVAALVVLLVILALFRIKKGQRSMADHWRQQNRHLDKELQKANKQLLEVRSVVVGLGQRVSEQQDIIQHLNERISELEQEDGDGRLYSRATKMVQLGADVNELIEECELPKAEAELMLSLQKKIAGKEKVPPLRASDEHKKSAVRRKSARK
ncbi:DUF2802 domain-containing protein [Vibrio sp. Isolate23]|uniref:DUF2802 domain-containing protein n=1 Tax=unclassified Vibrio TaxID=2614977 RepID=UPI001EFCF06A|nr:MULTISPECIES: DUF2802 domain-containing protein [unclassified Vibrio]MCG9679586.1 DUF2802 domain-containing protein [Vibrio sp. Isolate24]MCG9682846.1 DUF2802 domain-containing protein [Vibrio sp. Isolate23]